MRVLIVDDNVEFLATARRLLGQEGLVVVGVATSGAEALERAQQHAPDVILVDIELGDESGFDVVERLSAVPALRSSLVLVSAHPREDLEDLLETSPAIGFLAKSELTAQGIVELLDREQ
jgi:two-component system nitrate/nitrite response regulator NarL